MTDTSLSNTDVELAPTPGPLGTPADHLGSGAAGIGEFIKAANEPEASLLTEFVWFLREHKAWWLVPILLALTVLLLVAWLSSTAVAPFIYPLF